MSPLSDPRLAINGGTPVRSDPWPSWPVSDQREVRALEAVVRSGVWGLGGEQIREFCRRFAEYHHARFAVAVANGTAALEVGLTACGLGQGDECIIPAYTFVATATACLKMQVVPVFAEIDPDTFTLDPADVERRITPRTRAIMPVHVAGCPCDMDALLAVARKHDLRVIEDACQAHGAEWKGRRVGAIGDCGGFSFQSSKNLTAGEGGAVVTDDEDVYARAFQFHNVGRAPEGSRHQFASLGSNYRMTEWQAAVLLAQFERLDEQTATRNRNALHLSQRLAQIEGIAPARRDERVTCHAYHLYVFRYDSEAFAGLPREEFLRAMGAEGVPCSPGYSPLYHQQAFQEGVPVAGREVDYGDVDLPVTERACQQAVWLGQTMLLATERDMDDVVAAVEKVQRSARG
jgi:dTDP-4-amino-4,6-dideoxygalactose transaminase